MAATSNIGRIAKTFLRRPDWLAAFAISGIIIWLHIYFLIHAGGFWRDEVNLINLAGSGSLNEMSKDSFPILMPLLVRVWSTIDFGHNEIGLRLLGILIGLALPAALWFAAWKIKRSPPLLGLVLLALNSNVIMFGDSLRAYGLGSLTILLTTAGAYLFLKNPTWPRAGWLAVLAILSVQALYQNAVLVAGVCFGAWAVCLRQKDWRAAVKIFTVAAASAASLLPYWSHIVSMPKAAVALRTGFKPVLALGNADNAIGFPLEQYFWVWGFLIVVVVACAGATFFRRQPNSDGVQTENWPLISRSTLAVAMAAAFGFLWFAVLPRTRWVFLPLMVLIIAGLDSDRLFKRFFLRAAANTKLKADAAPANDVIAKNLPLFAGVTLLTAIAAFAGFLWFAALATEPWYFLPLMSLVIVCIEIGLPRGRHALAAIFGFSIVTVLIAIPADRSDLSWRLTNIDLVAQRLTQQAAPEDFIVVNPWYCGITFNRYFKGATPWNTLPPLDDHSLHRFDLVREQMQKRDALQPVFDQMTATLRAGHRVWIASRMGFGDKPRSAPVEWPPPSKSAGWLDKPYSQTLAIQAWTDQCEQFLADHSREFKPVYYTTNQNVNFTEDLQLRVAEGWRDKAPAKNLLK